MFNVFLRLIDDCAYETFYSTIGGHPCSGRWALYAGIGMTINAGWKKFSEMSRVLCGRFIAKLEDRSYKSSVRSVIELWI